MPAPPRPRAPRRLLTRPASLWVRSAAEVRRLAGRAAVAAAASGLGSGPLSGGMGGRAGVQAGVRAGPSRGSAGRGGSGEH